MGGNLALLTLVHVMISVLAIGAGFAAIGGLLEGRVRALSTWLFLGSTALTCITGFVFPINGFTPALGVGIVALVVLLPTCYALVLGKLMGRWRVVYVVGAITLVYLNFIVLVAQMFLKVPAMQELAPTQREAPFAIVQLLVFASFVVLGIRANARFKSPNSAPARPSSPAMTAAT